VTICLVTDRRRLVPADAPEADARRCLLAQARYAVEAGIDLIQVRERDLEAAPLAALVADVLALTRRTPTRGVHLRADSVPPAAARRLAPSGFLIGRSVHTVEEAAAADGADYLIAGTLFETASKPRGHAALGVDGLRAIVRRVATPVLAIGGVTAERVDAIAAAGAAGIAAIGLFAGRDAAAAERCRAIAMRAIVADARNRFDRVNSAP
jgi:thiamine-phosphate pyrophosphorylase